MPAAGSAKFAANAALHFLRLMETGMSRKRYSSGLVLAAAIAAAFVSFGVHARGGSASGYRGSASWGGGSGSASGRYGGTASWQAGSGGSATTARGGTASWSHGSGSAIAASGASASWNHSAGYGYRPPPQPAYYRAPYPAATRFPAPVYAAPHSYYVNPYDATTGEVAAAGVAGLAVGAMAGSSAAKKQQSASSTQTSAPPPQAAAITSPLPVGSKLSSLPPGCTNAVVKSVEYYGCGPNWFKPVFGSSGVYYQVVPQPF